MNQNIVTKEKPKVTQQPQAEQSAQMIAVILVRGLINVRHDMKRTLESLKLLRKNTCIIRPNSPELKGMLIKAKDYLTWGEINADTSKLLKGESIIRLNSPKKGFGRKGIKKQFSVGGGLGYRGKEINDLIKRMQK